MSEPAHRKKTLLFVLFGVVVAALVVAAVGGGVLYFLFQRGQNRPVSAAERAIVVTFDDLALRAKLQKADSAESLTKTTFPNTTVEYRYEEKQESPRLFVQSSAVFESTSFAAGAFVTTFDTGFGIGSARNGGVTRVRRDELLRWGDESRAYLLQFEGNPIGNVFVARKGSRVFTLVVSGVYFDDPDAFGSLLLPKLEALERYEP